MASFPQLPKIEMKEDQNQLHPKGQQAIELFRQLYRREPEVLSRAPGRVAMLGAHVDYSEGWVLPAAIDKSVWLAAAPAEHARVTVYSHEFGQRHSFDLSDSYDGRDAPTSWFKYLKGVAWSLQELGYPPMTGMDAALASDVPMGSGVSSSAALEIAFMNAWLMLSNVDVSPLTRAQIGRRTENHFMGVGSGIMDQVASVFGEQDHMLLIDCRSLEHQLIPVPQGTAVIVAESGVRRALANSDYNSRPQECREAVDILRGSLPHIQTLRDVTADQLEIHGHRLPPRLRRRARHVVEECDRVKQGAEALRCGDLSRFGQLMRRSQISSRDNYENSIPEFDLLASAAWQQPGCYGARFAGGGFGGVMQIFCDENEVFRIERAIAAAFEDEFSRELPMFTCKIAKGAQTWRLRADADQ